MDSWSSGHFFLYVAVWGDFFQRQYMLQHRGHPRPQTGGAKEPRSILKNLSLIIFLPVHSHPMAPITGGMKSKVLSLAQKACRIRPLPTFQIPFTPLSLSLPTVQSRWPSVCSSVPSLDLCTCSSPCLEFFLTDCCGISLSRFQLKCHILRAPP